MNLLKQNIDEYLSQVQESKNQSIDVMDFEWEKVTQVECIPSLMRDVNLIVCSDCLYDSTSVEPLLQTLELVSIFQCCSLSSHI